MFVSKTNGDAILALASHLYKSSTRLNTKPHQQEKATLSSTPKQGNKATQAKLLAR